MAELEPKTSRCFLQVLRDFFRRSRNRKRKSCCTWSRLLVTKPLNRYKDVKKICTKHAEKFYHKNAISQAEAFMATFEGRSKDVVTQLNVGWRKQIEDNRKRLVPIIKTVQHCGKQGIAIRGDNESGILTLDKPQVNDGNFRACLRLRLQAGDDNLKRHLETCTRNSHYLSWKIQNEIISATGKLMKNVYAEDANAAGFFSVLCDGTTDISVKEQMSLVLRFLNNKAIHEVFVGFEELSESTDEEIATKLLESLSSYGLDLEKLLGQGYDGCASVKGHINGVQAHVKRQYPTAIYIHCASHVLNLIVSKASNVADIANCVSTIKDITTFVRGSAKRLKALQQSSESSGTSTCEVSQSNSVCETRWVDRHKNITKFVKMFPAVLDTLEGMAEWSDNIAAS